MQNNSRSNAGAAYTFVLSGGIWVQTSMLKAHETDLTDDYFGMQVATNSNGTTVPVAASDEDGSGQNINPVHNNSAAESGAVYVYTP